jgi:hypothetical protein
VYFVATAAGAPRLLIRPMMRGSPKPNPRFLESSKYVIIRFITYLDRASILGGSNPHFALPHVGNVSLTLNRSEFHQFPKPRK